ncbi:MAG: carboxymuconolactone decarboxylase family protein [Alphaproteobacteria bacterium]|nr:carboxymuconolactone decarboxylase family protein [Alphaproteobacteria bacterium]
MADGKVSSGKVLAQVEGKRGYRLSYHRMLAAADPDLLAAYDSFYERLTLRPRVLGTRDRELVWTALLASAREAHGTIHLKRAEAASVSRELIADAIAIAAAVEAWPALVGFGHGAWSEWLGRSDACLRYERMFIAGCGAIEPRMAETMAIVSHAARRSLDGMKFHLPRAFKAGASRDAIAEGLSYLLMPCGAPALIDAVEAWAKSASEGCCPSPYGE